jgi:hypothetical protein
MSQPLYSVDAPNSDGQWRVWWVDEQGATHERYFWSEAEADDWIYKQV